ncbi:hypothetical protein AGMMS49959_04060 [Planctomycetales bacterium]|nr:hypothetical protein AGMMS49959_04060 [Planctomycetales bacterium]
MPTYDYECDACGEKFELFQAITAAPVKKCPHCGKPKARRLIGAGAGIIFKGGGFYETDYKRAGGKKDDASAAPATATDKATPEKTEKKETAAPAKDTPEKPAASAKKTDS